jgi:pimeloyl-ACP methyl ester carboxylesterase
VPVPLAIFASIVLIGAVSGCDSYFFYPLKEHLPNPALEGVAREDILFRTPDGVTLHGWLLRPEEEPRGTVLFLHGNAENVSTHVNSVLWLVRAGYRVVLFDYRGYGRSEGKPTMSGVHADALAAIDALFGMEEIDRDRVAVLGQSLGGAVAIHAVAGSPQKDRIRALVVDSAFSGYREIAREKIAEVPLLKPFRVPLSRLVTDRYSPRLWIARVSPVPVLVIHGDADRVVPPAHGERLFALAGGRKALWIVPGAGHIEAFASPEVRARLLGFLSDALEPKPVPAVEHP